MGHFPNFPLPMDVLGVTFLGADA